MIDKKKVVEQVLQKLEVDLGRAQASARAAHEDATHEESKAEDQYDTRAIEASYLAGAQAGRVAELEHLMSYFKHLTLKDFAPGDAIDASALVETECSGRKSIYFVVNHGGGISVKVGEHSVNIITPGAPLGEALMGKKVGDLAETNSPQGVREYEIVSLR